MSYFQVMRWWQQSPLHDLSEGRWATTHPKSGGVEPLVSKWRNIAWSLTIKRLLSSPGHWSKAGLVYYLAAWKHSLTSSALRLPRNSWRISHLTANGKEPDLLPSHQMTDLMFTWSPLMGCKYLWLARYSFYLSMSLYRLANFLYHFHLLSWAQALSLSVCKTKYHAYIYGLFSQSQGMPGNS